MLVDVFYFCSIFMIRSQQLLWPVIEISIMYLFFMIKPVYLLCIKKN